MELPLKCNLCDHRTDSFSQLRLHLNTIHTNCKVGYECFFCSRMLKTPFDHREHLISKHGKDCDLTTPPPTGRPDPRKIAQAPIQYLPPFEARIAPTPPKRRKTRKESPKRESSPIDWEAELRNAMQEDSVFDVSTSRPISPLSPLKKDFGVQVRKRDFLTTSRDTQTESVTIIQAHKITCDISTQTSISTIENYSQTVSTQYRESSSQTKHTNGNTTDTASQANFFNAGLITHNLMDAIKSIAPYVSSTTASCRQIAPITPVIPTPDPIVPTRRRGRPRRATPVINLDPEDNDFAQ